MTAFPTPWRPLYEGYAALAWLGGLILLLRHGTRGHLP